MRAGVVHMPSRSQRAFALITPLLVVLLGAAAQPPARVTLRWVEDPSEPGKTVVELSGLAAKALDELSRPDTKPARWQQALAVHARQGGLVDVGMPPMLGEYRVEGGVVRFRPRFPLEPGVEYRAVFRPGQLPGGLKGDRSSIVADFRLPARRAEPSTVVRQVYPSGEVLPENLLKFYVHFSAPMSRGHIYDHIRLQDESGKDVELPFLEIDEELWDPSMTRLTLFIDPGRIKRGVQPLEEIGPALEEGKRFALVIDAAWRDAAGAPLKETFRKPFRVGPPDREPPEPAKWKVEPPRAGAKEPLTLTFDGPMDHALAERVVRVARASGNAVGGVTTLAEGDRRWSFVPDEPWAAGRYEVVAGAALEDLAGNNVGKPFEVDLQKGAGPKADTPPARLPFDVH